MLILYELIRLLPQNTAPLLQKRLEKILVFLQKNLTKNEGVTQYLGSAQKKAYFNKLLYELKKALIRHIISLPSTAGSPHKAMIEDCHRNMAIYKILLLNNQRSAGIEIAQTLLPGLIKLEFHGYAHTVATDLLCVRTVLLPLKSES